VKAPPARGITGAVLSPAFVLFAADSPGVTVSSASAIPVGESVTPATALPSAHQLRSGLVVGLALGAGIGGASGYPNNSSDIGNPADHSSSGWMPGTTESIFLMGALSDYLSFGFLFDHGLFKSSDFHANGDGGGFRIEAFPLVSLGPRLQGLGLLGQFGVGTGTLVSRTPDLPAAQGTQSFATVGVFYEWSVGSPGGAHLGLGPGLEYDAIWSRPFESHGLVGSLRVVFYTGG
jgi:hypothetical protein